MLQISEITCPPTTIGIDISEQRIKFAKEHYSDDGLHFFQGDIRKPLSDFGMFDFIWIRFVLEYYRKDSFNIVNKIFEILKPNGIFCLIDLDYNSMTHYGIPERLNNTIRALIKTAEKYDNFDPYCGRKLYTYLYDLGCEDINVSLNAHHLIYGKLKFSDQFNFSKKIEVASSKSQSHFKEYTNGYRAFVEEFDSAFSNRRRFTYTPVICARGRKPY